MTCAAKARVDFEEIPKMTGFKQHIKQPVMTQNTPKKLSAPYKNTLKTNTTLPFPQSHQSRYVTMSHTQIDDSYSNFKINDYI